ncbi:MAG: hypothetical protein COZ06_33450 [Armatimonadetes bacterium CG_4_10_14_3_um_filter_66_18]|nr:hypothetical protein [Armatimonadota bacterium]OIP09096.1 MAG: hypothetical protein AUJ96_05580 [Armatimonadetes bacterium CG2_30_66_41]PIU92119.1 MAG: hypothetical protein COS65_19555 [Armatimonadetes bacterium CG06_land_8_20_14_3_00_66_21]PIX49383.1 MAG: hypothetical protein COZ57_03595 [Armatimonadetes bacterium CG_4_8_14_3_um_filter_66_20]PIY37205.1 MAG: hypothetical protein COZ06_33450 [Armatimonadetes bacterium CG_4_10_14_3_um_filter_66_18]PIZ33789.1 MAG: hypothetical protein COY42_29
MTQASFASRPTSSFAAKVGDALKKAAADAREEHGRCGLPLVVWRQGKVALVAPELAPMVRDERGKYVTDRPDDGK